MNHRAFVLLSGGMDSTTCLAKAVDVYGADSVEAVSIDYGQRHSRELEHAELTAAFYDVKHTLLSLGGLLGGVNVMLTNPDVTIPNTSYADISGVSPMYVPFRNGTMLSVITAHAQKWINDNPEADATVWFGAHAEDAAAWAYPDCTPEFIGAMANAIYVGTYAKIRLVTPLQWLTKKEVVEFGDALNVQWEMTWSCYKGGEKHCGICPTCRSRRVALAACDPTEYEEPAT